MGKTVNEMLDEREKTYGSFKGHALIAQKLKETMQDSPKWHSLTYDKKEALEMIQHKVARVLNGDPEYDDNWRDIAGYATLVENTLKPVCKENYLTKKSLKPNYAEVGC